MFEAIPKLCDERQTFRGRQTNDLIGSEQFHAFQPTKNRAWGQASENHGQACKHTVGNGHRRLRTLNVTGRPQAFEIALAPI
jgi:hypothetical protein